VSLAARETPRISRHLNLADRSVLSGTSDHRSWRMNSAIRVDRVSEAMALDIIGKLLLSRNEGSHEGEMRVSRDPT
jgi:hypothetical protein